MAAAIASIARRHFSPYLIDAQRVKGYTFTNHRCDREDELQSHAGRYPFRQQRHLSKAIPGFSIKLSPRFA